MLVREVAEAIGKSTGASRFSEYMRNHFMYGDNERLPEHIVALGSVAFVTCRRGCAASIPCGAYG